MDGSCVVLSCTLLTQMAIILIMLNPVYDVKKVTQFINTYITSYKGYFIMLKIAYFLTIIYLGMYVPLQNIHKLIFSKELDEYDKLDLLKCVEKNYIIAGFSLFSVVVMFGVRSLLCYAAKLVEITERQSEALVVHSDEKIEKKMTTSPDNALLNVLKVKRSISYETILFGSELREQLKAVIKRVDARCTLSSILENHNI